MNDHDFDAFFRKAAEQYRAPYKPGAWERMRRKLYPPKGGWGLNSKIIAGVIVLLLIGGSVGTALWYDTPAEKTSNGGESSTKRAVITKEVPPDSPAINSTEQSSSTSKSNETIGPSENPVAIRKNSENTNPAEFTVAELQTSSETWMTASEIQRLSRKLLNPEPLEPTVPSALWRTVNNPKEVDPAAPKEELTRNMRWRISLGVSPDISAINLGEASQVGSKMSVALEYFVAPRLSVQTGILFSNKVYTANGESYKPYPGYWKKYPVPNSIDAQCDVLDIPINLRYYALNMPRSRIFVSGGLSSYLMLTEDYVYHYRGGYGKPPYDYEHHERNKNRHYFKVANVSLGYERLLSRRWALQVEPFVKIPVAGVGFGKIKLSTTGMFVSLNYRLR